MPDIKKTCQRCSKPFLVIEAEQKFLEKKGLPLPEKCPNCRQEERLALRAERTLTRSRCDNCGKEIIITKDPDSKQKIFCRKCYLDYFDKVDLIINEPLPK